MSNIIDKYKLKDGRIILLDDQGNLQLINNSNNSNNNKNNDHETSNSTSIFKSKSNKNTKSKPNKPLNENEQNQLDKLIKEVVKLLTNNSIKFNKLPTVEQVKNECLINFHNQNLNPNQIIFNLYFNDLENNRNSQFSVPGAWTDL